MRFDSRFFIGVLIAVASLIAGIIFWNRAFPTAALQFSLTESAAQVRSRAFLDDNDIKIEGYLAATQFGEDTDQKNYIERKFGVPAVEKAVHDGVNLWYWTTRFFKPEQEEEFNVSYDPQGRFVGFFHHIKESQEAPFITRDQARVLAEQFLQDNVLHHPFAKLRLVEDSSQKRPHRTDYYFTWEQDDLKLGEAPYQLHISVLGNQVGSYNENVKVPEKWTREFDTQRSLNNLFYTFAGFAAIPIGVGAIVLFVIYVLQHRIRWSRGLPKRWLLLYAVAETASVLNDIPSILAGYGTTQKWGSFVFIQLSGHALGVLMSVAGMYLLSLIAEAIYREKLHDKLPFSAALGRGALYHPETIRALGVGIVLACFGIGYVCTFYVIANHFGAWSPVDIDYSKILGGPIPWISGLQIGLSAAWAEEFIFRVIGVLLYWKLTRFRWLAVILSCGTWAFLHSNYPQMPGYLRGCELTVEGVLWGAVMLRYGIVATLTGHYLYDCWLSSYVVFQSPSLWDKAGAIAVSFWPIALWVIGLRYLHLGHKSPHTHEEVTSPDTAEKEQPPEVAWNAVPLTFTWWHRCVAVGMAIAVAILVWNGNHPDDPMGYFGDLSLSRPQIAAKADAILRQHGQDPATYRKIATLDSSYLSTKYLLKFKSADEVADLYSEEWPDILWHIRYFRFGQKEEYNITLDKEGELVDWQHDILQEAPGASLSKKEALALAEKYLEQNYDIDMSQEKLVIDDLTQQEHRRDYAFTWERQGWEWGEARLRTSIDIQGNEPANFRHSVKVPEDWYREEEKKSGGWKDAILGQLSRWSNFILTTLKLIVFIFMIPRRIIPWRTGFLLALIPTALKLLEKINDAPWFYLDYDTTTPVNHYISQTLSTDAVSLFYTWALTGFWLNVTLGLLRWAFGWKLELLRWPRLDWPTLRRTLPDFVAILLLSLAIISITNYFKEWVGYFMTEHPNMSVDYPSVDYVWPWLASLIDALQHGYTTVLDYAFGVSVAVIVYRRWPWLVWTALLFTPFYNAAHHDTLREYIYSVSMGEFRWILSAFLIWKIWRFDVAMIFLVSVLPSLWSDMNMFWEKGGPGYENQAWPLVVVAAVLTLLAWWLRPEPKIKTGDF